MAASYFFAKKTSSAVKYSSISQKRLTARDVQFQTLGGMAELMDKTLREVCTAENVSRRAVQGYEKAGLVSLLSVVSKSKKGLIKVGIVGRHCCNIPRKVYCEIKIVMMYSHCPDKTNSHFFMIQFMSIKFLSLPQRNQVLIAKFRGMPKTFHMICINRFCAHNIPGSPYTDV